MGDFRFERAGRERVREDSARGYYPAGDSTVDDYSGPHDGDEGRAARHRLAEEYAARVARGGSGGGARHRGRGPARLGRSRSQRRFIAAVVFLGMAAFTAGFIGMWSLGSVIVGGSAFGGSGGGRLSAGSLPVHTDYAVEPLVNLVDFRDLAYVPVKAVAVMPNRTSGYYDRVIAAIDRTEINSLVITVKDDNGRIAFDTDMPLGKKYGTVNAGVGIGLQDLDALVAKLAEHHIMPIARIVCFKDSTLARKRQDMAVQSADGGVFVDLENQAWLNPYNHDAWEYLVQVAEECARRGFREIQFDYVRFPTAGTSKATYPGQYCAKEDAIAGFLAYARPRLEAAGVWVSADCFGWVVGRADDVGMGQKLEKLCQNVDVLCPMVYPSLYGAWSYGIEKPETRPYDIVYAALKDAAKRLVGTGAKGRPYLLAADGKRVRSTAEWVKAQIQAAEDLGFDEWMLWGGYIEEGLRLADGTYNGPALTTYGPGGVSSSSMNTSTTVVSQ
jgi:hypothetical protein